MKKDNIELICSIGELAGLFEKTTSLDAFLQKVVSVVAYHMKAAVCSVYIFDPDSQELVLRANQGLNPDLVGHLRLKLGEGITGHALKEMRPICETCARKSPYFKYIPGSYEERYESFLAVPILRGIAKVGVLAVQDTQPGYFDENDIKALRAIAAQLASTIENANLLLTLHGIPNPLMRKEPSTPSKSITFIKGISASAGTVFGKSTTIGHLQASGDACPWPSSATLSDFRRALAATEEQLNKLHRQMEERLSDVASLIFSAHLLMLKDEAFSGEMVRRIEGGEPVQAAILDVVQQYTDLFSASSNPMLREKTQDVKDLGHRLLHNLYPTSNDPVDYSGQIVIAEELLPSDLVKLAAQGAGGVVLTGGSLTAHIAILARSIQLPLVLASEKSLLNLAEGTPILLDAEQGSIFINPKAEVIKNFHESAETAARAAELESAVRPETHTRDGRPVHLMANINLLNDLKVALRLKAEGVGLYRSEFPFIVRSDFPSEEEQYRVYRRILETMESRPVVFRTLDIGGDKMLSYFPRINESNPFLGLRAIRFSLRNRDIFDQQLRALLRAGAGGNLKIMFPLISSVDDFIQARDIVAECRAALEKERIPHNSNPALGVMIEIPSAVEVIDELAGMADFLSIGSNDLVQYMLAVDRTNEHIADLYVACHPAVLRAIKRVTDAAQKHGKPLSICGEMAADPRLTPFLIGIGIETFSLDARLIPKIQAEIGRINSQEAVKFAGKLLSCGRVSEVKALLG